MARGLPLLVLALAVAIAAPAQAARLSITSAPSQLRPSSTGEIKAVVRGAKVCSLHFRHRGIKGLTYRRRLKGSMVRFRWRTSPNAAPGRWRARLQCARTSRRLARAGWLEAPLTVDTAPGAHGLLVSQGSMRFTSGGLGTQIPAGLGVATTCDIDGGGYCRGQCVDYVWSRRHDLARLGNAADWMAGARRHGIPTGSAPVPGAVAWWSDSSPYVLGANGHVAYVTGVGRETVTFDEMNGPAGPFKVDRQTFALDSPYAPQGYIYGGLPGG
jgi:hypothetical protein